MRAGEGDADDPLLGGGVVQSRRRRSCNQSKAQRVAREAFKLDMKRVVADKIVAATRGGASGSNVLFRMFKQLDEAARAHPRERAAPRAAAQVRLT